MECSFDVILTPMEEIQCISKDKKDMSHNDVRYYQMSLVQCVCRHEAFYFPLGLHFTVESISRGLGHAKTS